MHNSRVHKQSLGQRFAGNKPNCLSYYYYDYVYDYVYDYDYDYVYDYYYYYVYYSYYYYYYYYLGQSLSIIKVNLLV